MQPGAAVAVDSPCPGLAAGGDAIRLLRVVCLQGRSSEAASIEATLQRMPRSRDLNFPQPDFGPRAGIGSSS